MPVFGLFNFLFFITSIQKLFFLSRILSNTFSFLILPKIRRWKNFKFFFIKTMDYPHWKNPDSLTFSTFWFFSLKTLFSFLEYQNHGLSPLEKSQFFNFFDFLILESKNTFFLSRILSNIFCWLILPIIKKMENFQIFDQNHGVTPLEKCQFLDFLTFCFL